MRDYRDDWVCERCGSHFRMLLALQLHTTDCDAYELNDPKHPTWLDRLPE